MRARTWVVGLVIATGCPADPDAEGSGQTEAVTTSSGGESGSGVSAAMTATDPSSASAGSEGGPADTGGEATESSSGPISEDSGSGSGSDTGEPSVGTPGCMARENLAEGEHQFTLDGIDRRYIVRLPTNYSNDKPWPLIFALHGNGGNAGYWDGIGGNEDIRTAFAQDAIIIIPDAINNAWRDYDAAPETWPAGIELELNFFDAVLETAKAELCLDLDNVFSMGFSGGGSFSGVLGCRRDYIRAIAVGGSVIYFDEGNCPETPAAWITIGDGEFTQGRADFRDFFRDHAGCQADSTPGSPDTCENYNGCGADTPVTFCSHPAGHQWPSIGTDATKAFFEGFYGAQ